MSSGEGEAAKRAAGGVVFRVGSNLWFLPASIAMKVVPIPEMARVPGGPSELRGVALVDGNMVPVVDALTHESPDFVYTRGDLPEKRQGAMLVCTVLGEILGLVGVDVVATGRFEAGESSGEVKLGDEIARPFDVAALIARVREGRWVV